MTRDTSDYLWNHLCHRNEYESYIQKVRNKVLRFGTSAVMMGSRISGFMISFRVEQTMEYVINDDYTHIQAIIISTNHLKLKMARESPISPPLSEVGVAMLNGESSKDVATSS